MDIITNMKREYGLDISYPQAWWVAEKVRGDIFGDYEMSFSSLKWHIGAAWDPNPGSHILLEVDDETK